MYGADYDLAAPSPALATPLCPFIPERPLATYRRPCRLSLLWRSTATGCQDWEPELGHQRGFIVAGGDDYAPSNRVGRSSKLEGAESHREEGLSNERHAGQRGRRLDLRGSAADGQLLAFWRTLAVWVQGSKGVISYDVGLGSNLLCCIEKTVYIEDAITAADPDVELASFSWRHLSMGLMIKRKFSECF